MDIGDKDLSHEASFYDDDTFVTTRTNLDSSVASSSGSYKTAFNDSNCVGKLHRSSLDFVFTSDNAESERILCEKQSKKCKILNVHNQSQSGCSNGISESNKEPATPVSVPQDLHKSSHTKNLHENEGRNVQVIISELLSKKISDEVKAKNLASLNHIILQCKNYMQRYSVRQDLIALGLLNALPDLIESRNQKIESELEIFFTSESNDNLVGSGNRQPIDAFQAAYLKLKHTPSAEILLDILELIGRIQPSSKKLRGVINYLQTNSRNEGVQTEIFKVFKRPRSSSRIKRSNHFRMNTQNIPFIDDDLSTIISMEEQTVTKTEKSCSPKKQSALPNLEKLTNEKRKNDLVPSLIPPPPPLPPPAPEFLNPLMRKQPAVIGSPVVVKAQSVYKKRCLTNTVAWETIKPESVVKLSTIWSDQSGSNVEFNEHERERLEKVFERMKKSDFRAFTTRTRSRLNTCDIKNNTDTVEGLTEKRALNLGIVLARFRPLTLEQLIQKIQSHEIDELSVDYLSSLLKHFPTSEELIYFQKIENTGHLKDAELFCFLAAQKPFLKLRVELKVLADNIVNDVMLQLESAHMLLVASDKLYNYASLNIFFHRCLQYGNFLNQSTFAAGASGFVLSSLLSALNTKGNGAASNTRLVDILAEYADENLRHVVKMLEFLEPAKKHSIDDIEKSEAALRRSLEISLKNLQDCGDSDLHAHYSPIIMDSIAKCGQLSRLIKKIRKNEMQLKEYYCASKLNLENIIEILYQALKLFQESLIRADARVSRSDRLWRSRANAGSDIADVVSRIQLNENQHGIIKCSKVKSIIDIINLNSHSEK
ncbi:unnamed protein product [Thelazia callipaeda]|uniref:FH2 domain-containing protein n=1 Tax=Thelazia callipaeda TaxID=103827 RepID=A0A0N5CRA8_THECL|nr:unnamed protein product [Thelazia callipaeda]